MSYLDPTTELSVVAGTGFNGAVRLPTSSLAPGKYGKRNPDWTELAQHVLVDGELCVTGQRVFPKTAWDQSISEMLPDPDILGLEQLVGAFFVGEIIRQVIVAAVRTVSLFDGQLPEEISQPFSWRLENAPLLLM
jgi:hexokinase